MIMRKSQRTEVIVRNAKIEETGRYPFDVHTPLVEFQCCFCITFGNRRRTEPNVRVLGIRGTLLRCRPSSSLRVSSSRVWRASVSVGSVANEWLEEEAVPGVKNIGRNIMDGSSYDDTDVYVRHGGGRG